MIFTFGITGVSVVMFIMFVSVSVSSAMGFAMFPFFGCMMVPAVIFVMCVVM
jgi:hypothetical protein